MFGLDIIGSLIQHGPDVPPAPHVNLDVQQTKSILANQRDLPAIENLASGVNAFNSEQLQKMLEGAIPMYSSLVSGVSGNIESMLKGELPQDVKDQIQNSAAARALSGGYSGSGMANALTARDLGLNSLSLINQGISSAESWLGTMKQVATPSQFDVTSMFITPQQRAANAWQNQTGKFQRNWLQNQIDAAHDPVNILGASLINTDATLSSIVGSVGGAAAGGAAGGGGL